MKRLIVFFLFITLFAALIATSSFTPAAAHAPGGRGQVAAQSLVQRILSRLQHDYDGSSWTDVRAVVGPASLRSQIVDAMQRWRADGVARLHIGLVSVADTGRKTAVANIMFSADPRAMPTYLLLTFTLDGGRTMVTGTATGIHGRIFTRATWSRSSSAHFVVYHSPYQLRGADRKALQALEFQRQLFARKFRVQVPTGIAYYLYPRQSMMKEMTRGGCGSRPENVGCASPFSMPPMIHTTLWPTYHEPIHIYERALEPKPARGGTQVWVAPLFISEGTAVALEDRTLDPRLSDYCSDLIYVPLDDCARIALQRVEPPSILSDSGFKTHDAGSGYALGGDFVKYAILRYGYQRFGRFYYVLAAQPKDRLQDYDRASRQVFHLPMKTLLNSWVHDLCRNDC